MCLKIPVLTVILQADNAPIKLNVGCCIQGDVVLEFIQVDEDLEDEELMFRVMFNTAFIQSHILLLTLEDIDVAWDVKDQLSMDFKAEVGGGLFYMHLCNVLKTRPDQTRPASEPGLTSNSTFTGLILSKPYLPKTH